MVPWVRALSYSQGDAYFSSLISILRNSTSVPAPCCCRAVAFRVEPLLVRIVGGRLAIHLDDEMVAFRDDLVGDPFSRPKHGLARPCNSGFGSMSRPPKRGAWILAL